MHGKGKNIWPDGKEYSGDWVNNLMEGDGNFNFADGRKYEG